ncbi:MAG: hypothetical protein Harvfovirus1_65 [Harvfovirus sp.]|uniref:Uncharacterized protein n=1 Tax=Harvfovirus sp. TaxID=2487768 RepID=A0A3G4ZZZ0_9VIRU|nr:MAG: hypothetical protein Harvfovirus1_65 [Harvfovirus sp.]
MVEGHHEIEIDSPLLKYTEYYSDNKGTFNSGYCLSCFKKADIKEIKAYTEDNCIICPNAECLGNIVIDEIHFHERIKDLASKKIILWRKPIDSIFILLIVWNQRIKRDKT